MTCSIPVDSLADVHCHLRTGDEVMSDLITYSMMGGADIVLPMPNTEKGLRTAREVMEYIRLADQIVGSMKSIGSMLFIPTVVITPDTLIEEIKRCAQAGVMHAKVYPLLRTTNAEYGVRHYARLIPIIKACGEYGITVHFHPEHPSMLFENPDAEFAFLSIADMFLNETDATIVWEHGTDARCIPHWKEMAQTGRFLVTLTAHHLATSADKVYGDVRLVCKPTIKTERDRSDLVRLVEEDHPWVMAGTDSAPHPILKKYPEEGCCACGAFTAPFALPLYAHALSRLLKSGVRGVETFIGFTSRNARQKYGLPSSSKTHMLVEGRSQIPRTYNAGNWKVPSCKAGEFLDWHLSKAV